MRDIQRWVFPLGGEGPYHADVEGSRIEYVTYADHIEALRQAEQRGRDAEQAEWCASVPYDRAYEQGQRDALAGAVQRVMGEMGAMLASPSDIERVIAAIKGDEA